VNAGYSIRGNRFHPWGLDEIMPLSPAITLSFPPGQTEDSIEEDTYPSQEVVHMSHTELRRIIREELEHMEEMNEIFGFGERARKKREAALDKEYGESLPGVEDELTQHAAWQEKSDKDLSDRLVRHYNEIHGPALKRALADLDPRGMPKLNTLSQDNIKALQRIMNLEAGDNPLRISHKGSLYLRLWLRNLDTPEPERTRKTTAQYADLARLRKGGGGREETLNPRDWQGTKMIRHDPDEHTPEELRWAMTSHPALHLKTEGRGRRGRRGHR